MKLAFSDLGPEADIAVAVVKLNGYGSGHIMIIARCGRDIIMSLPPTQHTPVYERVARRALALLPAF